jgi:hypothetical protein
MFPAQKLVESGQDESNTHRKESEPLAEQLSLFQENNNELLRADLSGF